MEIICPGCEGTYLINGLPCKMCRGPGGENTGIVNYRGIFGVAVGKIEALADTVANILDKVNDIKEKVDEIKAVVDEL